MKTLYDLLGALPHDDAEGLRTAFRRAVKGAHPDIRPDDPDAALRFREIVRANEILTDAEQREAYDHLLELARLELEQEPASKRAPASRIHKLTSGVIALTAASAVSVGGYLLFMYMSSASVASANNVDVNMRVAASEARSLQARGISVYRDGDLNDSMAEFDWAFQFHPKRLPAYIEPAVIFYRLRKFDGVFPDIAPAKASRFESAPTIARKPRLDRAAVAPWVTPLRRWRTAAQDPSRGEMVAQMR
jgi:curved DNA-binding protein CbpA